MTCVLPKRIYSGLFSLLLLTITCHSWAEEPQTVTSPSPMATTAQTVPVTVTFTKIPVKSVNLHRFQDKYDCYQMNVQNHGSAPLVILNGDLPNHVSPEQAYASSKKSPGAAYGQEALVGLAFAPLTFGLSLAAALVLIGPGHMIYVNVLNKDYLEQASHYPGKIALEPIPPGANRTYALLVPRDTPPTYTLTLQDEQSKATYALP